jgi:hypothetical protein
MTKLCKAGMMPIMKWNKDDDGMKTKSINDFTAERAKTQNK